MGDVLRLSDGDLLRENGVDHPRLEEVSVSNRGSQDKGRGREEGLQRRLVLLL